MGISKFCENFMVIDWKGIIFLEFLIMVLWKY